MRKIRLGNDFTYDFQVFRNNQPENLDVAYNVNLYIGFNNNFTKIAGGYTVAGSTVSVNITPQIANKAGTYTLKISYQLDDLNLSDAERKCVYDVTAFELVERSSQANDTTAPYTSTTEII